MIPLTGAELAGALGVGRTDLESCGLDRTGISIDSRTLTPGDLFFALRGEQFDGHDFVPAAFAAGASAAVVEEVYHAALEQEARFGSRLLRVADTLAALGSLARAVRRKSGVKVVAVTGSVGKTSTKDLLRAMVATSCPVIGTASNQNNEIGVPLTLLQIDPWTEVVVVEMGMRGHGQIRTLAEVAEPDVALITNVEPVHLELVGTIEEVARAKAELLESLRPGGVAVVPAGSSLLERHVEKCAARGVRVVSFALGRGEAADGEVDQASDVTGEVKSRSQTAATLRVLWPGGEREVRTSFSSRHLMRNAVAAAAACHATGLRLSLCLDGLQGAPLTLMRGEECEFKGLLVINDTYNANPAAMKSALGTLMDRAADRHGRAVAVLGDMLELGTSSPYFHRDIGEYAANAGVELLWTIGERAADMAEAFVSKATTINGSGRLCRHAANLEEATERLTQDLRVGDVVLVKASRGMRFERVVEEICRRPSPGAV